jgi:Icc protein
MTLQVLQLTDIHLCEDPNQVLLGVNPEKSFDRVLMHLRTQPLPDLLLLTGDLTNEGSRVAYQRLQQKVSALHIATYYLPGNHDRIDTMTEVLHRDEVAINRSVIVKGWHIILLNSAVPGQVEGKLGSSTLHWLQQTLQEHAHHPTLIALHHPVLPLGCTWLDRLGLQDSEAFWQICGDCPQVKGVIAGHAHQEHDVFRFTQKGVIRCMVTPSTCAQFKASSAEFATDQLPPGFRRLTLEAKGNISTTVHRVL